MQAAPAATAVTPLALPDLDSARSGGHRAISSSSFVIGTDKNGALETYDLQRSRVQRTYPDNVDLRGNVVSGRVVRSFDVGTRVEGCAADDAQARFYIAEQNVGLWRYGAEPDQGTARVLVDSTGAGGNLVAAAEGSTIAGAITHPAQVSGSVPRRRRLRGPTAAPTPTGSMPLAATSVLPQNFKLVDLAEITRPF